MIQAPGIEIHGPDLPPTSVANAARPLWTARLAIVGDARPGSVVDHNLGLRVLLQDDQPGMLHPHSKWEDGSTAPVTFHTPRVLHGVARADDALLPYFFSCDWLSIAGSVGQLRKNAAPQTLVAATIGEWPEQRLATLGGAVIEWPKVRLAAGRIRVSMLLHNVRTPLQKLLGARLSGTAGHATVFGSLTTRVRQIDDRWSLDLDLTPQGIEFNVRVPHPGAAFLDLLGQSEIWVRARLVPSAPPEKGNPLSYRLELIGAANEADQGSAKGVQQIRDALVRAFGSLRGEGERRSVSNGSNEAVARSAPLRIDFDSRPPVPPIYWGLDWRNGNNDELVYQQPGDSWHCGLDTGVIRARIVSNDGGQSAAEVVPRLVTIRSSRRTRKSTIHLETKRMPGEVTPVLGVSWRQAEGQIVNLERELPKGNPSDVRNDDDGKRSLGAQAFEVSIDTEQVADQLARTYRAARALPASATHSPYAFVLLDRGILQIPLPFEKPKESKLGPPSTQVFRGLVVCALDERMRQSVELDAARQVIAKISFDPPSGDKTILRGVTIHALGARGVLRGLLWMADSSPTPVEVIPNVRNGPVATRELPLRFGGTRNPQLPMICSALHAQVPGRERNGGVASIVAITFEQLAPAASPPASQPSSKASQKPDQRPAGDAPPEQVGPQQAGLIAWLPHDRLPLVSSAPMTRSAASTAEPYYSRGLMPFALSRTSGTPTCLSRRLDSLLPSVTEESLAPATSPDWPWPAEKPVKESAVSMLPLTLPGIELAPQTPVRMEWRMPRAALRFDLPILDELYSGTELPKTTIATAKELESQPPPPENPTALNLDDLAEYWKRAAQKLSLALTAQAYAVRMARTAGSTVFIDGLIEPYVWETTFSFDSRGGDPRMGEFRLAEVHYAGDSALRGLRQKFAIIPGKLVPGDNIQVVGFAPQAFESAANFRFDNRGFGIAEQSVRLPAPPKRSAELSRAVRIAKAGRLPDDGDQFELVTADEPLTFPLPGVPGKHRSSLDPIPLGGAVAKLWFRDLPMVRSNGTLVFEGWHNIERFRGPDRATFERENAPRACYEWRFWQVNDYDESEFEVSLGVFRFRPLRLHRLILDPRSTMGGGPRAILAIAGLLTADKPPPESKEWPELPPDDAYPSGNLALLEYNADRPGSITLRRKSLLDLGYTNEGTRESPSDNQSSRFCLPLRINVDVEGDGCRPRSSKPPECMARLSLELQADIQEGVVVREAELEARLFGIEGKASTRAISISHDNKYQFTFEPRTDSTELARLEVPRMVLSWKPGAHALLRLWATLKLAVQTGVPANRSEARLEVAAWELGRSVQWLGLSFWVHRAAATATEEWSVEVDHATGTIWGHAKGGPVIGELVRGMPVQSAKHEAIVALAGATKSATMGWPSAIFRAGYSELNTTNVRTRKTNAPDSAPARSEVDATVSGKVTFVHVLTWESRSDGRGVFSQQSHSRLIVDWPQDAQASAIGWPVFVTNGAGGPPAADSASEIRIRSSPLLKHLVRPAIRRHELDVRLISPPDKQVPQYVLRQPWSFRALVEHELTQEHVHGSPKLVWRSFDDVTLFDLELLQSESQAFAFAGRNRTSLYRDRRDPDRIKHAGVVERGLAQAGFPMDPIGERLASATGPEKPTRLAAYGSSIAIVEAPDLNAVVSAEGYLLTMPWLLSLESVPTNLGLLQHLPQSGGERAWRIASADVLSAQRRPFDRPNAVPLPLTDASESGFEASLIALFPDLADTTNADRYAYRGVEQPLFEPVGGPVPNIAHWPLWYRTLLTVSAIWEAWRTHREPPSFSSRVRMMLAVSRKKGRVIPISLPPPLPPESAGASAAKVFAPLPDPAQPLFATLLVIDDTSVRFIDVPALDAVTPDVAQRITWQERGQAVVRVPRLIVVGRGSGFTVPARGALDLLVRSCRPGYRAHAEWTRVELRPDAQVRPRPLREFGQTLHASPALGWPKDPETRTPAWLRGFRVGAERPIQDETYAIAGRIAGLATAAQAFPLSHPGFFFCSARRVTFENPLSKDTGIPELVGPPVAHLYPVPPRMRTLVKGQFDRFTTDRKLAPILPGGIERFVLGLRPGVLYMEYDGLVQVLGQDSLDRALDHFGRRAEIGAVVFRQLRSPRSTRLPVTDDLSRRRRTFVSRHDRSAAADEPNESHDPLLPFLLLAGTATAFRSRGMCDTVSASQPAATFPTATKPTSRRAPAEPSGDLDYSVVIRPIDPHFGVVAGDWDGKLTLLATAPAGSGLVRILQNRGLLGVVEEEDEDGVRALKNRVVAERTTFVVGVHRYQYDLKQTTWKVYDDNGRGEPIDAVRIELPGDPAIRRGLCDANADTPLSVVFVLKTSGVKDALQSGTPPHTLMLPLRLRPTDRPTLPILPATLIFGDPAYDRELGSAAKSGSVRSGGDLIRLALDREAYDPEATIYFAFGKIDRERNRFECIEDPPEPTKLKAVLRIERRPFRGDFVEGPVSEPLAVEGRAVKGKGEYTLTGSEVYSIPMSAFRHLGFKANGDAEIGAPVAWNRGDVLSFALSSVVGTGPWEIIVYAQVVAEPVIAPPSAVYGLVLAEGCPASRAGVPLFASGPKPQLIEFPKLLDDLASGYVRRRALYLWYTNLMSDPGGELSNPINLDNYAASLVKYDRAGGGQLPNGDADFYSIGGLPDAAPE